MSSSANRPRRPVAGERARQRAGAPSGLGAGSRTPASPPPTSLPTTPGPTNPPAKPAIPAPTNLPTNPAPLQGREGDPASERVRGLLRRTRGGLAGAWGGLASRGSTQASAGEDGDHSAAAGPPVAAPVGRRGWVAPIAALVASLALLGTLVGLTWQDPQAQARANREATNAARVSIQQMLSYNYKTIDAQAAQIETLLTGSFKNEFTTAMNKEIKPLAVKNQTVVQARVSDVGVLSATPTTVRVLAFVNQARVGVDQTTPSVDQNRVIATMSQVGGRWLVSKVSAF